MQNEKIINGKLCWRVSFPEGEWIEYTLEELTIKIGELELRLQNNPKIVDVEYEKAPWWANPHIKPPVITC